jgi:hypothetical protein
MHSEMRRPEPPKIDRFIETLDRRLRLETLAYRRAYLPPSILNVFRKLKLLAKPLAQSGAMALTALVIIVAISATPAARLGVPVSSGTTPLAAPSPAALTDSNVSYLDYLPAGDLLAFRNADISDIGQIAAE